MALKANFRPPAVSTTHGNEQRTSLIGNFGQISCPEKEIAATILPFESAEQDAPLLAFVRSPARPADFKPLGAGNDFSQNAPVITTAPRRDARSEIRKPSALPIRRLVMSR